MKKLLSALLLSIVFVTNTAFAILFPDVPDDHMFGKAIKYLEEKGIISGYSDGTFKPDKKVSRAEAVKIIVGAFSVDHSKTYEVIFSDVKKDAWHFPFVMGAKSAGLVQGYSDGTFRPDNSVTLAETLKIALTAGKVEITENVSEKVFVDVPAGDWYAKYALYARNHNIVLGNNLGEMRANREMTRGEFAEVIYRTMIVVEKKGASFPLDTNWPTYENQSLNFSIKYSPDEFNLIEHDDEIIFFRPDEGNFQYSPGRIYPNSAVVRVTVDPNIENLTRENYFQALKSVFKNARYTEFTLDDLKGFEVLYSEKRTVDWYLFLPNNKVLIAYTEYGDGGIGYKIQQFIKAMLNSLKYKAGTPKDDKSEYEDLKSEIFQNILVEGKGMTMIKKLPDEIIIETDTLGVGTGPVDYYFSAALNHTFKYERSLDVILAKREGRTSAF